MKKVFALLIFLIPLFMYAQIYQAPLVYGKTENRFNVLYNLAIPNTRVTPPASVTNKPHIAIENDILYYWSVSLQAWVEYNPAGAGSPITWTAAGDVAGSAVGTTTITPTLTVNGLKGAAIPALATGFLKWNGSAWIFDNAVVATETDPQFDTKLATKTTDNLTEGSTNLYFTNARARSALSLTTTGTGAATYNSATGVFNIPQGVAASRQVNTLHSLTGGGPLTSDLNLALVNDVGSPGASKYYGTNVSGVKGWFTLPTGGTGATNFVDLGDVGVTTWSDGDLVKYNSGTGKLVNFQPTYISNITGLVSQGTGVTITGTGTSGDPYVVNSSGEANTASNLGGGLANWDSKNGVDLRFNTFATADFDLAANVISIDGTKWLTIAAGDAAYQPLDGDLTAIAALSGTGYAKKTGVNTWTLDNSTFLTSEVDGSVTNELQTLANTSNATTHTVTLSNSGGSIQLVEGSNITLTTSGTGLDGIVTIAATGTGANALGTYIVQTSTNAPANAQILASLGTGLVKNTTTTGVLSIATAGTDYVATEVDPTAVHLTGNETVAGVKNFTSQLLLSEVAVPGSPAAGTAYFYMLNTDDKPYWKNAAGNVYDLTAAALTTGFVGFGSSGGSLMGTSNLQFDDVTASLSVVGYTNTGKLRLSEYASVTETPATGKGLVYALEDGKIYYKNDGGTVYDLTATGGGGTTFADPTASIGLTAINGVATTAMRSDAAPALSQAIVPTWTGVHTYAQNGIGTTITPTIILSNSTSAAAGAQQMSPTLEWIGSGWKTNATAQAYATKFRAHVLPIQGTANVIGEWKLQGTASSSGTYQDAWTVGFNGSNPYLRWRDGSVTGFGGMALAPGSLASGDNSLVIGGQNGIASGLGAVNIGTDGTAGGNYSLAANDATQSLGINASTFGFGGVTYSENGFNAGNVNYNGHTAGTGGTANLYDNNITLGSAVITAAQNAISIGTMLSTTGDYSMTLGRGTGATRLSNSVANSLAIGFNSDIPTFRIHGSTGASDVGIVEIYGDLKLNTTEAIANDDALTKLLVQAADGTLKYRTVGSLPGGFTNPMTTLGDIMYEDATPAAARLAGNTTTTKMFLSQTGTGTISAAPAWSALSSGDIPDLSSLYIKNQTTQQASANFNVITGTLGGATDLSSATPRLSVSKTTSSQSSGANYAVWNYNTSASQSGGNSYALNNFQYVTGTVGGGHSGAATNTLYLDGASYSYTTNQLWSALRNTVTIQSSGSANRIANTYLTTEVYNSSSVTEHYYGLYIEAPLLSGGGTIANEWPIWQESTTGKNYFAGEVFAGSATDAGNYKLQVTGNSYMSSYLDQLAIAAPTTPAAGVGRWYTNSTDGKAHYISPAGVDYDLTATSTGLDQTFANTNLTADANRTHDWAGFWYKQNNLVELELNSSTANGGLQFSKLRDTKPFSGGLEMYSQYNTANNVTARVSNANDASYFGVWAQRPAGYSEMYVYPEKIMFNPYVGKLLIDTLNLSSGSNQRMMTWDITTGDVGYQTISSGGVTDGDKGDITVSGSGATWTIDNSAVTLAKIANIADGTILGNNSGSAAAPIALTAAQTKTLLGLNNVENTALSTWAGSSNITTLGTIATGVWGGTDIANAAFRQSAGLSVVGRSANSTGDIADITGTDGQVLRVSGTTLGFGTIDASAIGSGNIATARFGNNKRWAGLKFVAPTASEHQFLMRTIAAVTIESGVVVVSGTSPSVTFAIHYGSTYGTSLGTIVASNTVTATGAMTINVSSIPANSYIWLDTSATSGTVTDFTPQLNYILQ